MGHALHLNSSMLPAKQGKDEWLNKDLCIKLMILCEETDEKWENLIGAVEFFLDIRIHQVKEHIPFCVMSRYTPNIPSRLCKSFIVEEHLTPFDVFSYSED